MIIRKLHSWSVFPHEAVEIQKRLQSYVCLKNLSGTIRHVAGADISCSKYSELIWAGVVVFTFPELKRVEECWVKESTDFPYIPGLLSFREAPSILNVMKKLKTDPDLLLCDGQGIAHPRRLGLASHLGLFTGKATIGCAKSRLVGEFSKVGEKKGDHARLMHKGCVVGAVLRSRSGAKPIFVSPGNMITLEESLNVVMDCCTRYRIPEPVRQAHLLVNRLRRSDLENITGKQ